jgi:peptide/nickel transport system substrate-binding protein
MQDTPVPGATVTKISLTATTTIEPTVSLTPELNRLVICMAPVPVPFNPYSDVSMVTTVLQVVNDGPVDYVGFQYYPVLLEKIPDAQVGEVLTQSVAVRQEDRFFDPLLDQVRSYSGPETTMQQMTVRFSLRDDVAWSDGVPLTAYDSEYAYQQLTVSPPQLSEGWQSPTVKLLLQTESYRALDEQTIEWVGIPGLISSDYPRFFFAPLPGHLKVDLQADLPIVGWGAYQIKEFTDKHLLLERNPHYFRANEGLPVIDEVELKFLEPPYSQGSQPELISTGVCHILSVGISYYTPPEDWLEAAEQSDIQVINVPGNFGLQLIFNLNPERNASIILEPNIRQAIASCIDRASLANQAYGTIADSYVHPFDPAFISLAAFNYNPAQGSQLVEEYASQKGIASTNLKLSLAVSESHRWVGEIIQDDLRKCNLDVTVDYIAPEEFSLPWPQGAVYGGKYDMVVFPLGAIDGPACNSYHSGNIPSSTNPIGSNVSWFNNPEFDRLCYRALSSLDEQERLRLHQEAQTIWGELLPAVPLIWTSLITGADCRVDGYQIDPTGVELWNIEEIGLQGCDR